MSGLQFVHYVEKMQDFLTKLVQTFEVNCFKLFQQSVELRKRILLRKQF